MVNYALDRVDHDDSTPAADRQVFEWSFTNDDFRHVFMHTRRDDPEYFSLKSGMEPRRSHVVFVAVQHDVLINTIFFNENLKKKIKKWYSDKL